MTAKRRRQLELGLSQRDGQAAGAPRERRASAELDLGYARLRQLYELGKMLGAYEGDASLPALLGCLGESMPLRAAMVVEVSGDTARIHAARAESVPDAELEAAAAHARTCTARLMGLDSLASGELWIAREPLPSGGRAAAPGRSPFAALPLTLDRSEVCGALYVRGARQLGEADLAFLSAAADQLSLALGRNQAWQREVRLRERAEELDRAQKELVAVVSHDLRNPIGAVLLGLSTLRRWPQLEPAVVRESLDTIHRAAERASRMVHDLLDVARLDAGLGVDLQPVELGSVVREAAELMKPLLADSELLCEVQLEEGALPLLGDRERLLQVLSNLIGNARKFAPPGTRVTIAAWREEGEARCCVADQGPGIAPADLPRVFDRYFQGPHGPTAHGAGLGLSIARGIVLAHSGRIWADSAVGRGTRFVFALPLAP